MEHNRSQWSSNFGFLMAAIGSAVGLGNLWGFPLQNGGERWLPVFDHLLNYGHTLRGCHCFVRNGHWA